MKNKFNVNDKVLIVNTLSTRIEVGITTVDAFGATPHYGVSIEKMVSGEPTKLESGWMPVSVVDAIAVAKL